MITRINPDPRSRPAGWVLLGDGLDSAIGTERMEIVRGEVQELDEKTGKRYDRAMLELDRALVGDAWDDHGMRWQINVPLVDELNRQGERR